MAVDWNAIGVMLTSSAVVVAGLAFMAKAIFTQFLKHDIEILKSELKEDADTRLKKLEGDNAIGLAAYKADLDERLKQFDAALAKSALKEERVRLEIDRWSNPILGAVRGLHNRLKNILDDDAFVALHSDLPSEGDWKLQYDYFFPSTIFLFAQYFCWVRLLEERLTFDLFEQTADRDDLLARIRAVQESLSTYPLPALAGLAEGTDTQLFFLQQRQVGEALISGPEDNPRCMRYAEFAAKWNDMDTGRRSSFRSEFYAVASLVDQLSPVQERRWHRLHLAWQLLVELDQACTQRLNPSIPQAAA